MDDSYEGALIALTKSGAVSECEFHGYLLDESDEGAVAAAKIELAGNLDGPEVEALVAKVLADAALECPGCAQNNDD